MSSRQYDAWYRETHKAEIKAYNAMYYLRRKEHITARNDAYRKAHWDEHLERTRARYWKDPEKLRVRKRRWDAANREFVRRAARDYAKTHPKERSFRQRQRVVRRYGNGGSHTLQGWREKLALLGSCCMYCGIALTEKTATRDHKVPLSRGGSDDISNILPACKSCNCKKRTKTAYEYLGLVA